MKVVGYTFNADTFCVNCTKEYVSRNLPEPHTEDDLQDILNGDASFGDSEGNPIHAMFDTDESGDTPEHCGDCHAYIDTAWSGDTADYAIEALQRYVEDRIEGKDKYGGDPEVLDEWEESLQWVGGIGTNSRQQLIIELYKTVREHESR